MFYRSIVMMVMMVIMVTIVASDLAYAYIDVRNCVYMHVHVRASMHHSLLPIAAQGVYIHIYISVYVYVYVYNASLCWFA